MVDDPVALPQAWGVGEGHEPVVVEAGESGDDLRGGARFAVAVDGVFVGRLAQERVEVGARPVGDDDDVVLHRFGVDDAGVQLEGHRDQGRAGFDDQPGPGRIDGVPQGVADGGDVLVGGRETVRVAPEEPATHVDPVEFQAVFRDDPAGGATGGDIGVERSRQRRDVQVQARDPHPRGAHLGDRGLKITVVGVDPEAQPRRSAGGVVGGVAIHVPVDAQPHRVDAFACGDPLGHPPQFAPRVEVDRRPRVEGLREQPLGLDGPVDDHPCGIVPDAQRQLPFLLGDHLGGHPVAFHPRHQPRQRVRLHRVRQDGPGPAAVEGVAERIHLLREQVLVHHERRGLDSVVHRCLLVGGSPSAKILRAGRCCAPFEGRRDSDGDTGSFSGYRTVNAG